ncbi:hypothetical protein A3I46_01775 [Candidatus Kaiserbacteria bacterium RIFCSPLOWO2_02_FULL_54_13]|uniref:Uncharacterized protein n=1 Tax=Candidatus Kaiserbacteria bacterium RIFCSPHIGHO2_02_FULL_54_22 TaxID=1798495 RepID=A0A1F6DNI1_9BACT|nr:MAG: hypothetical protein A3C19_01985 [Candidatus Kaiserbacteria bacterium RIFCSPHIGHO2_02_FULL_54_22]OGG68070.1 MAG: hypothetical protein A3E99_02240 [Candidatus Kaiserbacteria bacterium RIFCSPHIGHO2_12_FULL_54_16]OGG82549.1 MAG: hypothetical protein A3I46_01775 [Candidatus Kaiserbacteria bacterium RIFCSPLOWO2_02_FULL_54_13]OGG90775.1 MAG: hypothetical protein A3G12_02925 [Candidatus Kaiserbacteria bacterium RIFCSPLOWO2_12_FULL_54_10]
MKSMRGRRRCVCAFKCLENAARWRSKKASAVRAFSTGKTLTKTFTRSPCATLSARMTVMSDSVPASL